MLCLFQARAELQLPALADNRPQRGSYGLNLRLCAVDIACGAAALAIFRFEGTQALNAHINKLGLRVYALMIRYFRCWLKSLCLG